MTRRRGDKWRRRAIEVSGLEKPDCILDGCAGTGLLSLQLAQVFSAPTNIVAVDFCPAMVSLAKQKVRSMHLYRRVEIKAENVELMPFPDEFFDAVFISFGMRFVSDVKTVLAECQRVMKKDTPLIILEYAIPSNPWQRFFTHCYREYFFPFWARLRARVPGPLIHHLHDSLVHYPDADKMGRMLIQAGFDEVEYEELSKGVVTLHRAIKPGTK